MRSRGWTWRGARCRPACLFSVALATAPLVVAGCNAHSFTDVPGVVNAIGAENEYADVLGQIGGRYVHVLSVLDNPNTDPHTFELSPALAQEVSAARLIVQNGLGYDDFMGKVESASPSASRKVIVVQRVLGVPDDTPNPHLWYDPRTMPLVAKAMADDLAAIEPLHAAYFQANLRAFDDSLTTWTDAVAAFRATYAGTDVATTEPVADYLLEAMGLVNVTPFQFQADIMNGVDPAPETISQVQASLHSHLVKVFCYNDQVVDALTASIRHDAETAGIPVVAVYETMPSGYDYQSWMLAEERAIEAAVTTGKSTTHL